jgi:Ax21 family sulfation-dependent quorum factor
MKMKLFALAMAAALPLSAQAEESDLSYTHVEADYINLDHGTDGWGVRGSVAIGDSGFYGLGSYSQVNTDNISGHSNTNSNELGVGYHHAVADKTDLIGELAYRNADNGSSNIDGARASVGVRSALAEHVEGFVKANYYDASDYHGDVTGTVGGQYKFTKTWGATAEAELGNGNQAYLLGVRASF